MSVVVIKNRGQLVPKELVERIVAANPKAYGCAAVLNGTVNTSRPDAHTTEDFMKMQTAAKEITLVSFFSDMKNGIAADDIQPFELMRSPAGDIEAVAFLTGDFPGQAEANGSHTPEFYACAKALRPQIEDLYSNVFGQDVDKLFAGLSSSKKMKEIIEGIIGQSGTITLLAKTGQLLTYGLEAPEFKADWGWTSNHYGLFGGKAAPAEAGNALDALLSGKEAPKETKTSTPVIKQNGATKVIASTESIGPKTETKIPAAAVDDGKIPVPTNFKDNGEKKRWFKDLLGFCPPEWKTMKFVEKSRVKDVNKMSKALAQMKESMPAVAEKPNETAPTKEEEAPKEEPTKKDTAPHNLPGQEQQPGEPVPFMPAEVKEQVTAFLHSEAVVEAIDKHGKEIEDPMKMNAKEARYPTFAEITGIKLDDPIPYELALEITKSWPEAAALLITNFVYDKRRQKLSAMTRRPTETPAKTGLAAAAEAAKLKKAG